MTEINGAVALVTGGNRGLGKAFVTELLNQGAAKVYAAARDPKTVDVDDPRVVPVRLDVTDPASAAAVAAQAGDLTVLINNAGISVRATPLHGDLADVRREFETNFYGPINVTRALAPIIAANGGGAIVNVHSVLSWVGGSTYSATKAALWSATNTMRGELEPQHIQVVGLHVGYIDTDMAADIDAPKSKASDVARVTLDGVRAGAAEVLADELTRQVKTLLSGDVRLLSRP